tara:strand:- start:381 stop:1076 length:696 start_codon:yes stop_codon:yes gene_type:complete
MKKCLKCILSVSFLVLSCRSNDDNSSSLQLPTVESQTTVNNAEITFTTLKIDGHVISNGGSVIIEKGVCWSTNPNPTTADEIILQGTDDFSTIIDELISNTNYYFKVFATNEVGTSYSTELSFKTLNLADTGWVFTTYYSEIGDFSILSKVDFYADQTTRFDELDLPGQCPGCFITYGSWSLVGNNLTYIWDGTDTNNSTYIYTGVISGMIIEGTYTHQTTDNGFWTAIIE